MAFYGQVRSRFFSASCFFLFLVYICSLSTLRAQEKEKYVVGLTGQLEMIVHIIGEVKRPGEYHVSDATTLMDLISKAEGPTEFSNLGGVTITRIEHEFSANGDEDNGRVKKINKIIKYNLNDYLKKGMAVAPPVLKPGDVILVPRNNWYRWRSAFTVIRDLSVIVTIVWLIDRAAKN